MRERGARSTWSRWLAVAGMRSVTSSLRARMIRCSAGRRASGLVAGAALVGRLADGSACVSSAFPTIARVMKGSSRLSSTSASRWCAKATASFVWCVARPVTNVPRSGRVCAVRARDCADFVACRWLRSWPGMIGIHRRHRARLCGCATLRTAPDGLSMGGSACADAAIGDGPGRGRRSMGSSGLGCRLGARSSMGAALALLICRRWWKRSCFSGFNGLSSWGFAWARILLSGSRDECVMSGLRTSPSYPTRRCWHPATLRCSPRCG